MYVYTVLIKILISITMKVIFLRNLLKGKLRKLVSLWKLKNNKMKN